MPTLNVKSFQKWLGAIIVVLSVVTVILMAIQTSRLNSTTACQAAYNDAYTTALQDRTNAARNERQAQRELLQTLLSGPVTPEQGRAAFDRYLKKLDEADVERESAKIPANRC
jgi:hypothetical protein